MSRTGSETKKKRSFNLLSILGLIIGLAVGVVLSRWDQGDGPVVSLPRGSDEQRQWDFDQASTDPLRSAQIQEIQKLLAAKGYDPGTSDGKMTAATEAAIKQYQRDSGKNQSGRATRSLLGQLQGEERPEAQVAREKPPRGIGISRKRVRSYYDNSSRGFSFNWQKPEPGLSRVRAVSIENQSVLELIGPEKELVATELTMPLPDESDAKAVLRNAENLTTYLELVAPESVGWAKRTVRKAGTRGRATKNFGAKRVDIMPDRDARVIRVKVEPVPAPAPWVRPPAHKKPTLERTAASAQSAAPEVSGPKPGVKGETITLVVSGQDVRLCPNPECLPEDEILWVTASQKLTIADVAAVAAEGAVVWDLIWYKVVLDGGPTGWISEYDTDRAPERPRFR